MGKIRIRDPGWKKNRIRDPDKHHYIWLISRYRRDLWTGFKSCYITAHGIMESLSEFGLRTEWVMNSWSQTVYRYLCFKLAFGERDKKRTMTDLRKISTNLSLVTYLQFYYRMRTPYKFRIHCTFPMYFGGTTWLGYRYLFVNVSWDKFLLQMVITVYFCTPMSRYCTVLCTVVLYKSIPVLVPV